MPFLKRALISMISKSRYLHWSLAKLIANISLINQHHSLTKKSYDLTKKGDNLLTPFRSIYGYIKKSAKEICLASVLKI